METAKFDNNEGNQSVRNSSPVAQGFKIGQPDGKQLAAFFFFFHLAGFADFGHHPFALGYAHIRHLSRLSMCVAGVRNWVNCGKRHN